MGTQRERTRTCSKVDGLPEDMKKKLDEMLARTGEGYLDYQDISDEITEMGFPISRSSIGRYAIKNNSVVKRLKEAQMRTTMLLEAVKNNQNIEATEMATAMFVDQLVQKMATAESDIEDMPIGKAADLLIKMQRSTVYTAKYKLQYEKGVDDAANAIKKALTEELNKDPELLAKISELADRATQNIKDQDKKK
jgi:hypothetical protein